VTTDSDLLNIWNELEHEQTWTLTIESDDYQAMDETFDFAESLELNPDMDDWQLFEDPGEECTFTIKSGNRKVLEQVYEFAVSVGLDPDLGAFLLGE
jgi:hypothetical protein